MSRNLMSKGSIIGSDHLRRKTSLSHTFAQGSPLGRDFGVFVDKARVTMLGLVPSIARAWRASNCMQAGFSPAVSANALAEGYASIHEEEPLLDWKAMAWQGLQSAKDML